MADSGEDLVSAAGTETDAKAEKAARRVAVRSARLGRSLLGSPIARLILASNLIGLVILVAGALVLNELRAGLVQAQASGLVTQGQAVASLLAEAATVGEPEPALRSDNARELLRTLSLPPSVRAKVFTVTFEENADGVVQPVVELVADSVILNDTIDVEGLPPPGKPGLWTRAMAGLSDWFASVMDTLRPRGASDALRLRPFEEELAIALERDTSVGQRFNDAGERIISVSLPVQRVSAVVGVLTLESSDLAEIVKAERQALLPFAGVAILVALATSVLLTLAIARPLRRLAVAADKVRAGSARSLDQPRLARRGDEIGDLARSLDSMTEALQERINANESFAADVAHEIKNPLTSIRSAVETAERVGDDPVALERLRKVIAEDVNRLDRLITDISNASRLEAEIAREADARVDLARLLGDIVASYDGVLPEGDTRRVVLGTQPIRSAEVRGLGGPLGQVFRNIIDNAISFSPQDGEVIVSIAHIERDGLPFLRTTIEDQGPGIPPDKLDKVFERFYSDRPSGSAFGKNSGLGLSIVKQIVTAHRGYVSAENREGPDGQVAGARFIIDLRPV